MKINSEMPSINKNFAQIDLKRKELKFKEILKQQKDKDFKIEHNKKDEELKKLSKDFESIFVGMMFKEMRNSVFKSGLLDGGLGREIFEDMYYNKIAKETSEKGELGLGKIIYEQFSDKK